jgi:alpha-L-fucosidase 2
MSVSDTGEWVGNFWPSFTDYACTGWVAHLMWLRYRYTLDTDFLRNTAYPFMKGAMRVYQAVLEEENGRMVLPMGTSPEYNWSTFKAVGKNPSFQLACIHFLLEALIAAAGRLDVDPEDVASWKRLKENVPPYTTVTDADANPRGAQQGPGAELNEQPRIAILEGQDLGFSHRHHSHLAALHPFDTVDPEDEETNRLLRATLHHWLEIGLGNWIAFSFTSASIIYSRMHEGEAAWLHYDLWYRLFTNEHRGAVELACYPGITTWTHEGENNNMQMDALMGAINAIQEMLLHTLRGTLTVFPAIPRAWQNAVSFRKMRAEGAFLISATMQEGRIIHVEIFSEKGAELKLANNIATEIVVFRDGKEERTRTKLLTLQTAPGETITITA